MSKDKKGKILNFYINYKLKIWVKQYVFEINFIFIFFGVAIEHLKLHMWYTFYSSRPVLVPPIFHTSSLSKNLAFLKYIICLLISKPNCLVPFSLFFFFFFLYASCIWNPHFLGFSLLVSVPLSHYSSYPVSLITVPLFPFTGFSSWSHFKSPVTCFFHSFLSDISSIIVT